MKKLVSIGFATLIASIVGCATGNAPHSMRGDDVEVADHAPDVKQYTVKTPGAGGQHLISRTFLTQPPLIPHSVEKYIPIKIDDNACLECHVSDDLNGKKMPKMGVSHFSKTKKETDGSPSVEMSRFQCDTCHVPQVDAKPLVENQFVGVTKNQ